MNSSLSLVHGILCGVVIGLSLFDLKFKSHYPKRILRALVAVEFKLVSVRGPHLLLNEV